MDRDTTTDPWLEAIAAFAAAPAAAPDGARRESILVRVVDAIGCALGSLGNDAPAVAAAYAARRAVDGHHTVWGTSTRTDAEGAALANGVATRYLDYNDAYFGMEPIHPSDVIPTLFAAAVERGSDAGEFLDAVAVAYEVAMEAADRIAPRQRGFDHVNVTMLGAAAGAAVLFGLTEQQARHAVSIAVTSHGAFRQARHGELSMWKAFAAADACRHALYAVILSSLGARGPAAPFTGQNAFFARALGLAPDQVPPLPLPDRGAADRIGGTQIKRFPCGSVGQSAGQAAVDLVESGTRLDDVAAVDLRLDPKAAALMVSPEKMAPGTRETADHSIPYVVVSTLARGALDVGSFGEAAIGDDVVRSFLRDHVSVDADPALGGGHDMGFPIRLTLTMKDGTSRSHAVEHPPGSPNRPMTRAELRSKFDGALADTVMAGRADTIWDAVWSLGTATSIADLDRLLQP
ncbi:MmgE/PrpD family protein [Jiangella asiatica]|uniref:MmgE/PrpD family protein n=1 Tax=Jiangella asiatica TaxID=2530372 RepID=A0A4R5D2E4_9ACTN|nr:MmgE/PrpD family protein [Jiangella asiatica]TDE07449.1 MmgE/PrpD family protein [Jiangella asiatica]